MVMKSIDLFTGIGGMTLALRDLGVTPLLYCDKDPDSQRVLSSLIKKKWLPKAPIHQDVRKLTVPGDIPLSADMILAGFPCQGFSNAGARQGLRHDGSSLVSHVYRIVRRVKPKVVFLENVSALLDSTYRPDLLSIFKTFSSMGYDGRYVKMHGYDVECPQKRQRLYMLFYRRGASLSPLKLPGKHRRFSWKREPVPRLVPQSPGGAARCKLLGNSVIPELTRLAFLLLWTGFRMPADKLYASKSIAFCTSPSHTGKVMNASTQTMFQAGSILRGVCTYAIKPTTFALKYRPPTIVLDPKVYKNTAWKSRHSTPPLTRPLSIQGWGTIRTKSTGGNTVLTERGSYDIGTQIRFATNTPAHLRSSGKVNPEFYEWLMGYRTGWTM